MPKVFHVKGRQDGELAVAQAVVEAALGTACGDHHQFDSKTYTKAEFIELLHRADGRSIIYYDGHGTPAGEIVLNDGKLSGDDIRAARRAANVFLHCCFSVMIATENPTEGDNLRMKIATLLSVGPGNVREEVNQIMTLVAAEYGNMRDSGHLATRIAAQMKILGLDRNGTFWGGICPLSIGKFNTANDKIIISVMTSMLDLL